MACDVSPVAMFWIAGVSSIRNYHRNVHNAGHGKDKNCVKEGEEISLGGEGGHEEANEGDAARVGDGQGEQAKKQLH